MPHVQLVRQHLVKAGVLNNTQCRHLQSSVLGMRSEVQRELRLTQHSVWDAQGVAEVGEEVSKILVYEFFQGFLPSFAPWHLSWPVIGADLK